MLSSPFFPVASRPALLPFIRNGVSEVCRYNNKQYLPDEVIALSTLLVRLEKNRQSQSSSHFFIALSPVVTVVVKVIPPFVSCPLIPAPFVGR